MFLNQTVPPPLLKNQSVIFFGGDVNIGRRTNWNLYTQPFGNLQIMSEADLRIINLECVVGTKGSQGIDKGEGGPYYYHARPEQINLLTAAQIDVVLTANNHSLDYYEAALLEQNDYLDRAGILHCGTGKNLEDAAKPLFIEVNKIVIALFNVDATMKPYAATADKVGTFYLPPDKPELWKNFFTKKIADARRKADIILIAPHWGPNGVTEPIEPIKILGRLLIDCGADAVLGCHSHFLHGVETYKDRPIIYDAGNFLFDTRNGLGGAFSIVLSNQGVEQIFFVPLSVDYCKTSLANAEQAEKICAKFLEDCRKLNTDAIIRRNDLIELKFTPPARARRKLKPVNLSVSRRGEKILPMSEPLPEWTADKIPDDARIDPQKFGAIKLLGCRIPADCLLMKRRQILYVETWWTLDAPTYKDLTIRIYGVPTVQNSMSNFGAGMDHQACDWMFPTNRWKNGVIYYERFGLRSPPRRELVNVDLAVEISVLDGKFELGKYIYPTKVQLQIPNRPSAVPNTIKPPAEVSVIDEFKSKFKAKNGVIFFMLRHVKPDASGLELSSFRRATLFKNYFGCEVFLLTNEYQNNLLENFSRYNADGKLLNMYDYFQGINRVRATPRSVYVKSLPEGWTAEQTEKDGRLYRQDGTLAMYLTFMKGHTLNYVEYFNTDGKKIRRDTFDELGFMSRRQILDLETGNVIQALYYKPNGTLAIKETYEIIDKKSALKSIEVVDRNLTIDHPRKLMRYWLEELTADKNLIYFLIGDRSPEYTRFYTEVKQRDLKNIFVLHVIHNLHVLEDFNPLTAPTKRWYNFLTDNSFQSDAIITLTEHQKADVVKRYGLNNVIVLPHSIPRKISAQMEREPYKIIMVGRLAEQKAPDKAIEVFKIVHEKLPQAKLHFYGNGAMLGSLKKKVKSARLDDAVIFEGFVNNIDEAFSTAAVSILTSRYEGAPLVIQESLQNNCPVVAFDCCYGPRDMIEDGVNGYLIPGGDVAAMADRIIKILTESGLREKLSANCAKSIEKFYPEVVAVQWAELFCKLMKQKGV